MAFIDPAFMVFFPCFIAFWWWYVPPVCLQPLGQISYVYLSRLSASPFVTHVPRASFFFLSPLYQSSPTSSPLSSHEHTPSSCYSFLKRATRGLGNKTEHCGKMGGDRECGFQEDEVAC